MLSQPPVSRNAGLLEFLRHMSWEEFLDYAKEQNLGIPPVYEIQYSHHYWVEDVLFGSADLVSPRILQWSPGTRCWYQSNDVSTMALPASFGKDLKVLCRVPLPPLTPDHDPVNVAISCLEKMKDPNVIRDDGAYKQMAADGIRTIKEAVRNL